MHLIELRSGREGHPTYRAVAQAMHERIASVHPAIAAAMTHVDASTEPRLERIMSEIRTHRKRVAADQEPAASDAPPGVSALGRVNPRSAREFRNTAEVAGRRIQVDEGSESAGERDARPGVELRHSGDLGRAGRRDDDGRHDDDHGDHARPTRRLRLRTLSGDQPKPKQPQAPSTEPGAGTPA